MDKELLVTIGEMLDKKLDEKLEPIKQDITWLKHGVAGLDQKVSGLDEKVTSLQRQNDIISKYVSETRDDIRKLSEGQFNIPHENAVSNTNGLYISNVLYPSRLLIIFVSRIVFRLTICFKFQLTRISISPNVAMVARCTETLRSLINVVSCAGSWRWWKDYCGGYQK